MNKCIFPLSLIRVCVVLFLINMKKVSPVLTDINQKLLLILEKVQMSNLKKKGGSSNHEKNVYQQVH